jgi:hypothetical protein
LQQDGATAHSTRATLAYLEEFYVDRIINRGLNPKWRPRSPDLTSLHFSIFGWLKDNVYKQQLHTREELMEEITHHCQNIDARTLENIFENKKTSSFMATTERRPCPTSFVI